MPTTDAVSAPDPATASPDQERVPTPSPGQLFVGFMRIASLSFGGVLPWARFVLVERRRWLTPQEFTDTLALCQLLPGPNIVNMSVAIGARFHGPVGAVASILGLMLLPFCVVLALGALYGRYGGVPAVDRALEGMAAAAAGLIVAMAAKMAEPILRTRLWQALPVMLATFGAIALMRWPMWPVVLVMAPLAVAAGWRSR